MSCFCNLFRRLRQPPREEVSLLIAGLESRDRSIVQSAFKESLEKYAPKYGVYRLHIFDVGDNMEDRRTWSKYYARISGTIFFVDSTHMWKIAEARHAIVEVMKHSEMARKPVLIIANKQHMINAKTPRQVSVRLSVQKLARETKCPYQICACSIFPEREENVLLYRALNKGLKWILCYAKNWSLGMQALKEGSSQSTMEEENEEDKAKRKQLTPVEMEQEEENIGEEEDQEEKSEGLDIIYEIDFIKKKKDKKQVEDFEYNKQGEDLPSKDVEIPRRATSHQENMNVKSTNMMKQEDMLLHILHGLEIVSKKLDTMDGILQRHDSELCSMNDQVELMLKRLNIGEVQMQMHSSEFCETDTQPEQLINVVLMSKKN
ncbi:ADP-ribosylation factor-like protein 13B [Protopterus annectens]|uniref:ADP-ribosylation factor-like protein 13B n=1 Tax=Protopterus annectens TaxID=7888 RepID=UPI001CFBE4FB|nr:ADP-ribosylation factor-like protein 13B [Protopterus annectens]